MIEAEIEKELCSLCERSGWECLKLELNGSRGFPDRTVLTPWGAVYFVELKRPKGGVVSPHQDHWRRRLEIKGYEWTLVSTIDEVRSFVDRVAREGWMRNRGIR